ncbi:DUF1415 domain-containing protein [Thalassomonas actiniarum]|uniref:DUF1415 domain-containing protein n=1 Tax=Thalassomonas actiniarum TaxID=485447 RepID=A0AAE9YMK3_9GAMM|nr:DUF1415 domain-containing protein [Thalassomonas actiniarum]WDD97273.1 DUF1415 domain-containing protein [Thalassomonas actiniarum]
MHPAIEQTKQWLAEIVIGLNFCPFAKKEFVNDTIHYHVSSAGRIEPALEALMAQCQYLSEHDELETSLVIFSTGFRQFERYLDLLDYANELLVDSGYEGIFQLASFHPDYCFEGEDIDDAANYTNRSPYPTIHLIREASMERVLAVYQQPEAIPENNIALAHEKGATYFKNVLKRIKKQ